MLVEVLCETALQRDLDEEVFARAYGIALPASIAADRRRLAGGRAAGRAVGLTGAIVATGLLAAGYAGRGPAPRAVPAGTGHRAAPSLAVPVAG